MSSLEIDKKLIEIELLTQNRLFNTAEREINSLYEYFTSNYEHFTPAQTDQMFLLINFISKRLQKERK